MPLADIGGGEKSTLRTGSMLAYRMDFALLLTTIVMASGATVTTLNYDISMYISQIEEANLVWRYSCLALFVAGLIRALILFECLVKAARQIWPMIVFFAFCGISAFWSAAPEFTIRRFLTLFGFALIIATFSSRYSSREVLRALALASFILATFSGMLILLAPDYGTMTGEEYTGAWRGSFGHKNILGNNMVIATATMLLARHLTRGAERLLYSFGSLVSLVLLIGSQSVTAYVSATAVGSSALIWLAFRSSTLDGLCLSLLMVLLFLLSGAVLQAVGQDTMFGLLGRDSSLTGRVGVWDILLGYVAEQPLLGFGYGSFWTNASGEVDQFELLMGWLPHHAHNGLLELTLNVGLLGSGMFVFAVMYRFATTASEGAIHRTVVDLWPALIATAFIASNVTEATIAKPYDLIWTAFLCGYVGLPIGELNRQAG